MAFEQTLTSITGNAGIDFTNLQYTACSFNASNQLVTTGVGLVPNGVMQNKPAPGQAGNIAISGISKVVVGSAGCNDGDTLQVDATGAFVTKTSGTGCAKALMAGVAGQWISAVLQLSE